VNNEQGTVWGLSNLDRFDGYPDSGEEKKRPLTVLDMWRELGFDPADEEQPDTGGGSLC
jgi:hypothetical protein